MSGTMTWVGLDVHARSTYAAALDLATGELSRMRFGAGVEAPVAWLRDLPGPVRACYEAGPTGFGLYRGCGGGGDRDAGCRAGQDPTRRVGQGEDRSQGRRAAGPVSVGRVVASDRGPTGAGRGGAG